MRKAVFIYSDELEGNAYPPECPFNTSRTGETRKIINSMGLLSRENTKEVAPVAAERAVLKKFHTARYLHALKNAAKGKFDANAFSMGIGSGDCPVFAGMYRYSALACGATVDAANLVLSGDAEVVFNPSGGLHHAGPEQASGFCYMNDMVLGCMTLAEAGKKVLYLDIDVHHGDGVVNAFYNRSDVMTISLHESGRMLFPGTGFEYEIGKGKGKGYCVNVPLPVGTYDQAYMRAFEAIVEPLVLAYKPDVIVFELGADGLVGDPLAHLNLTNNTYAHIIDYLMSLEKPILAAGGGGYNISNTVRAWALAWSIFAGAGDGEDMNLGVGGIMLETTDWVGRLRDRILPTEAAQREFVDSAIEATIEAVKNSVFNIHGL